MGIIELLFNLIKSMGVDTFNNGWIWLTLGVALYTFARVHWPLLRLRKDIIRLHRNPPNQLVTKLPELQSLNAKVQGYQTLLPAWNLYYRVTNKHDWSAGLPSPVPFFTQERLIDIPGRRRLAEAIPGFLTAMGILGTFIGLSVGLEGLDGQTIQQAEGLRQAIGPLLGGMTIAFYSSVIGILSSIVWSAADRVLMRATLHRLGELHDTLDSVLPPVVETAFLHQMVQAQRDQVADLKQFMTDSLIPQMFDGFKAAVEGSLAPQLAVLQQHQANDLKQFMTNSLTPKIFEGFQKAVQETLAPELSRTANAVEQIGQIAGDRQIEGVQQMVDSFMNKLNGAMGDQLTDLADLMRETVEWQRTVKVELSDLLESMQSAGEAQAQSLTVANQLLTDLNGTAEEFSEQHVQILDGARALEHVLEQLVDAQKQVQQSLQQAADAEARLKDLRTQILEITANQTRRMYEVWEKAGTEMGSLAEELRGAAVDMRQKLGDDLAAFTDRMHEGLGQTFGAFDEQLANATGSLAGVVEQMQDVVEDLPVILQRTHEDTKRLSDGVNTLSTNSLAVLKQMQENFAGMAGQVSRFTEDVPDTLDQVSDHVGTLSGSVTTLSRELPLTIQTVGVLTSQLKAGMELMVRQLETARQSLVPTVELRPADDGVK